MMKSVVILGIVAISLAACATPVERCGNRASREYRDLVSEITKTEGNIERGYAEKIVRTLAPNTRDVYVGYWTTTNREREYEVVTRVMIDPLVEQHKLETLRAQLVFVTARRDQGVAQCRASSAN